MISLRYQICTICVMDTSDPDITFNHDGVCNHCLQHRRELRDQVVDGNAGRRRLDSISDRIKREGVGKAYDCVIGVSGGVDSTYLVWLAKQLGLQPLAVHLDNGWNSDIAVKNIATALQRLKIDLYTHVIDWEEYKDIQRAFLLASVPDVEIPTDHAILACLSQTARRHRIRTILSGVNTRTESHLPSAWSQAHIDYGYIHDVHRRFGSGTVRTFPHYSFTDYLRHIRLGSGTITILDYADYTREKAVDTIQRDLAWRDYGGKHHESVFTRWYQGCYLPRKFGFDKRRSHLSSLISSGELDRQVALAELQQPPYDETLQDQDCEYVAKKLGFTRPELNVLFSNKLAKFEEFHSYRRILEGGAFRALRAVRRRFIRQRMSPLRVYSC